jgi:hypothetical protein
MSEHAGLGAGADGHATSGQRMAPLGRYHLDRTQTLAPTADAAPARREGAAWTGVVVAGVAFGLVVLLAVVQSCR